MPALSIVTPAYNRSSLLRRCKASLDAQTCMDFEWIVVDDGSTDDTPSFFASSDSFSGPYSVRYLYKENGGKHTALNAAIPLIQGEFVLFLDSDDLLTANAVELVLKEWEKWKNTPDIAMVIFQKMLPDGQICCTMPLENQRVDILNQQRIPHVSSDCCEVVRADVFRREHFPVFEGERFLSEVTLWYTIGLEFSCVCRNVPVYICEYLQDGLTCTGKKLQISNPKGSAWTSLVRMHPRCSRKERIKAGILYVCYSRFEGISVWKLLVRAKRYPLLTGLTLFPGLCLHGIWKWKYKL